MTDVVARPGRTTPGLRKTTLDNGLTVLSEFIPGVRSVAVGAWVRSASVHEAAAQVGVSHCLEHLVFKGTRHMGPREIALSIEQLGGSLDAYTSRDHTAFQARMLDEHLDDATRVIGELIFQPALRESDLKLEKKVILEEIGSVEDAPDDLVFELHNAALWGNSAFGWPILGTRETVGALRIADLRALHERAYRPALIVVAAAGSVEHEQLLDSLERGGWHAAPAGGTLPALPALPPEVPGVQQVHGRDGSQVHLVLGSRAIANADPRRHAFGLVSMLLGDGMSSRLFQRVREDLGLAYSVSTFADFFTGSGSHGVYLGTAPDTAAKAEAVVREELDRVATEGIPAADLAMAKQQLKGQVVLSMEGVSSRMYRAAATELYGRPWRDVDAMLAEIDAVDLAQVRQVCEDFFQPGRQTVVRLGPLD
ncbi:MAG: insulinase family protein [Gemmatimonadetes bacterium]|nr:insulinase family protein [Gemmatimonadota bacterium]